MKRRILLFAIIISSLEYLYARPYIDVRTFSLRDGLAANVISGIGQTSDGLMWFGTWNGLSYYDGYKFTTYRDVPGKSQVLTSNRILNIQPNSHGDVWVITYDLQLYLFDTHSCKYININKLISSRVNKPANFRWIYALSNGYTWVTDYDQSGLSLRIKDDNVEGGKGIEIFNSFPLQKALSDAKGSKHYPFVNPDNKDQFTDSHKRTWTFTKDGIIMKDGHSSYLLQAKPKTPMELTACSDNFFHEDEHGTVWAVPTNGTFSYYDEKEHCLVPYPLYASDASTTCIPLIKKYFIDSQNNMWFTGNRNLFRLKFEDRQVSRIATFPNREVRALCVDRNGNIWAGDEYGMLAVYDNSLRLKGYMSSSGELKQTYTSFTSRVYSVFQDSHGRIWIGSKGSGLYCIDNGKVRHFTYNDNDKWSLSHNDIYDINEDSHGRILVGTYGKGLDILYESGSKVRFHNVNNTLSQYPKDPKNSFLRIRRITTTKNGIVILSTNGGLVTYSDRFKNPQDIHFYTTTYVSGDKNSLASNDVFQTLITHDGSIYVNTMGGGLQAIEKGSLLQDNLKLRNITAVGSQEGLIQSMTEDKDGNIWLVRETTINKYIPSKKTCLVFGPADMTYKVVFSEGKPILNTRNGQILMCGEGCFIAFNPRKLVKNKSVPKIIFTSVQYQGDTEAQSILSTPELDVPSGKRNLTVYFSALDYSDNYLIQYAYKLDGIDDKWNYVGNAHSASLNRIPHGHLRLLVRSTNADGIWQDNTRALKIYAHPTFWESWMGWLLYIIIGGGIVFIFMYIYAQRQHIKMQAKLRDTLTTFFTNIGHKLRTPLTLIGGPVAEVIKEGNLSGKQQEMLDMVQRNSENMLSLVNSMLDYEHNPDNYLVDDKTVQESAPVASAAAGEDWNGSDIKLLVVEDNRDLRRFLFTILSSNYSVLTAENGQEGLEKAQTEMPDFIISDVMMPVMDGLTMVHKLKQDKNTSHIPIIILSAKASMQDRLQGLHEGIDDYITKPFSATYLKERVANIIARKSSLQQEMLEQLSHSPEAPDYHLSSPVIIDEDKAMMEKLMAFLEKNIDNSELKMEDMASFVNLGKTVFYGKMKSIVGMTPGDFLRHIRMQRAEELIVNSKQNFSQIAYAVGFTDPKYFSKCFKKETGMSPSEYRKRGTLY